MFKCVDGTQSKPKEKQLRKVTEVRKVTYINPNPDPKKKDQPILTEGYETVKEIVLAPHHYELMAGLPPAVVGTKTVEYVPPKKTPKPEYNKEERNGQD